MFPVLSVSCATDLYFSFPQFETMCRTSRYCLPLFLATLDYPCHENGIAFILSHPAAHVVVDS